MLLQNLRRVLALAIVAGIATASGAPVRAQNLVVVRVAVPPVDDATPVLYALHAGLFKKAGLDVQLSALPSGAAVAAAVAGGSVDIGNSSTIPLISAHARGVPFKIVAADGLYTSEAPYALMLVRADSKIHSGKDLNGKTVSSPALKDLIYIANLAWIDKNGGDLTSVHTIELPNSAVVPAIEEGRVDASTVLQPRLSQALANGKVRVLGKSFESVSPHFLISAWFGTSSYVAAHPDVATKFGRVVEEAAAYANAHRAETAALLSEFSKVDPKVLEKSTRETFATSLNPADIQVVIDAAIKYKVIDKSFGAHELLNETAAKT